MVFVNLCFKHSFVQQCQDCYSMSFSCRQQLLSVMAIGTCFVGMDQALKFTA